MMPNQEIYNIPQIKFLLDEREVCYKTLQETKTTLSIIKNERYHLGNICYLDSII